MKEYGKDIMIENAGLKDINPLICGEEVCAPEHSFGPARREYFLLHYVFSGAGVFYTKRGKFSVKKGQIFVVKPYENTFYMADEKDPWHYAWVGFEATEQLGELLEEDVLDAPSCAHIFKSLINCDLQAGREWFVCAKVYELFSQIENSQHQPRNRTAQYVRMAQNYIESNYVQNLRVDSLAASLNLDRSYFSQIFKRHTGKAPQQYIVDFRLEKAAELLTVQNLSPGEAGRQVGYNDIFNFSRMFSRKFGVPPSQYQAQQGESK